MVRMVREESSEGGKRKVAYPLPVVVYVFLKDVRSGSLDAPAGKPNNRDLPPIYVYVSLTRNGSVVVIDRRMEDRGRFIVIPSPALRLNRYTEISHSMEGRWWWWRAIQDSINFNIGGHECYFLQCRVYFTSVCPAMLYLCICTVYRSQ